VTLHIPMNQTALCILNNDEKNYMGEVKESLEK
jgi:hypothetical protein